jgi:hypothetical protein
MASYTQTDNLHQNHMPKAGCFQSFNTARRTIKGFEAMLWLHKEFDLACDWSVRERNHPLACGFGFQTVSQV